MAEGEVAAQHVVLAAQDVTIDGEFPTVVGHLTDVLHLRGVAGHAGDGRAVEQVTRGVPVDFRRDGQPSAEQRDVHGEVAGDGGLPLDVLVGILGGNTVVELAARSAFAEGGTARSAGAVEEAPEVAVDVVVTGQTEGCAELQLVNPFHVLQEVLLVDDPRTRDGGEVAPLVAGSELGGTVGTERTGQQILVHVVVGHLSEERGRAVSRGAQGVGLFGIGLSEGHVVQCGLRIDIGVEEVGTLLVLLILGVVDFLTEQERQVVLVLQREVVGGRVGPGVRLRVGLGEHGHRLRLVDGSLGRAGLPAVETLDVVETEGVVAFTAQHQSLDGRPLQGKLVGDGVGVFLLCVGLDVAHGVRQQEIAGIGLALHLFVGTPFAETCRGTVAEHINETARTDVVTTGSLVATIGNLRVVGELKVLGDLGVELEVDVRATYARAEDDTLVFRLGQREIEARIFITPPYSYITGVVHGVVAQHLVLPVAGGLVAVEVVVLRVAEVATEGLSP